MMAMAMTTAVLIIWNVCCRRARMKIDRRQCSNWILLTFNDIHTHTHKIRKTTNPTITCINRKTPTRSLLLFLSFRHSQNYFTFFLHMHESNNQPVSFYYLNANCFHFSMFFFHNSQEFLYGTNKSIDWKNRYEMSSNRKDDVIFMWSNSTRTF